MRYIAKYMRQSDRNKEKWTTFSEVLRLKEVSELLRWLEKNSENHKLISVEPYR